MLARLLWMAILFASCCLVATAAISAEDRLAIEPDLKVPDVVDGPPRPGKRVRQQLPGYAQTDVYHLLYLPRGWQADRTYPVVVEYAGNEWRTSLGTVEGSSLGYGLTGGTGAIWICMPYVNAEEMRNQETWWGDVEATVAYCQSTMDLVCSDYGGDRKRLYIAGFSRGAIACNYIGLHNDDIAKRWRGFICHSHYDGLREWDYPRSDEAAAVERLKRLRGRPQFISHENSVAPTREYLRRVYPHGDFTFVSLPETPHTDTWVLKDSPERRQLRKWFQETLHSPGDSQ
ncbi:MAG: hypothetical protein CMJ47_12340 [Planctomyces sp.]|nr:hypothetical protein [Planctomyces sp.]